MFQPPEIDGMVELVLHKVMGCKSPGPSRALCPDWDWSRHLLVLGEGPSPTPQSPLWAVSATSLKEGYQACKLGRIDMDIDIDINMDIDMEESISPMTTGILDKDTETIHREQHSKTQTSI